MGHFDIGKNSFGSGVAITFTADGGEEGRANINLKPREKLKEREEVSEDGAYNSHISLFPKGPSRRNLF